MKKNSKKIESEAPTPPWFRSLEAHIKLIQANRNDQPQQVGSIQSEAFFDRRGLEIERLTTVPVPVGERKARLPHEEWDFSHCPEHERNNCLAYELSREVLLWRTMVHNYRLNDEKTGLINLITYFSHIAFLAGFPDWPNKPWMVQNRRSIESSNSSAWNALFADLDCLADDAPSPSYSTFVKVKYGRQLLHSHFQIDLSQSAALIQRQFSSWLKHQKNKHRSPTIELRGKNTAAATLRALGVYRLLPAMPWQKAQIMLQQRGIEEYTDHSALLNAAKRAETAIAEFALDRLPPRQ